MLDTYHQGVVLGNFSNTLRYILLAKYEQRENLLSDTLIGEKIISGINESFDLSDTDTLYFLIEIFECLAIDQCIEIVEELYASNRPIILVNDYHSSLLNQLRELAAKNLSDKKIIFINQGQIFPGEYLEETMVCIKMLEYSVNVLQSETLRYPIDKKTLEAYGEENFRYWVSRGSYYDRNSHYLRAIACYELAAKQKPGLVLLSLVKGNAFYNLALSNLFLENSVVYELAIDCYTNAKKLNSYVPGLWNNMGGSYGKLGNLGNAKICLEVSSVLEPHDAKIWENIAIISKREGKILDAIHYLEIAISLGGSQFAYSNISALLIQVQEYDYADFYLHIVMTNWDGFQPAYVNKAILESKKENQTIALQFIEKAIEIEKDSLAWYNKAQIFYEMRQYENAIQSFEKAIELNPNDGMAYNDKGVAEYMLKRYNNAIQSLQQAIIINTHDTKPYNNIGYLFYSLGDYENGKKYYRWSLALNPNQGFTLEDLELIDFRENPPYSAMQSNGFSLTMDGSQVLLINE